MTQIIIDKDGMVRVDGIPVFRTFQLDGVAMIEFCDQNRFRSTCRGTRYVSIPLAQLVAACDPVSEKTV